MGRSNRIKTPLRQRLTDFTRGPLTFLIWIGCAAGAGLLLQRKVVPGEYAGLARSLTHEVSAVRAGQVGEVLVDLYDSVERGEIVAILDSEATEARIRTALAEIDQIAAEMEAERQRVALESAQLQLNTSEFTRDRAEAVRDTLADLRRFRTNEEERQLEALTLKVTLEADRIELERLRLRAQRARELVEDEVGSQADLDDARLLASRLERSIAANEALLARTTEAGKAAAERREEFDDQLKELLAAAPDHLALLTEAEIRLKPFREALRVQNLRSEEIEVERRGLVLRSPVAGQVHQLLATPGQAVLAGEPVVQIVDSVAIEVVAWLPENAPWIAELGGRAFVTRRSDPSAGVQGLVSKIGPAFEVLPERLWSNAASPVYGRPILIVGVAGIGLTPGESLTVRLSAPTDS